MPFLEQPVRIFDTDEILNFPSGQIGVYGLFRQDECIYVGAGDIRDRILKNLDGDNTLINYYGPTQWMFETVVGDTTELKRKLIEEYHPLAN